MAGLDEPVCSLDPKRRAVAFCTECVRPFSAPYLGIRSDGRAVCHACALREDIPLTAYEPPAGDPVLASGWLRAVGRIVARPDIALSARYDGPIGRALAFGFAATWFGFVVTTAWNLAFHGDDLIRFVSESTPLAAELDPSAIRRLLWFGTPLVAAIRLAVGAILFHLGTVAAGGAAAGNLRANTRVFALTSGTLVLCVVPTLGPFLALVTWFTATMAYLQARYGMRMLRRLFAVMPAFLVVAAIGPSTFVAT